MSPPWSPRGCLGVVVIAGRRPGPRAFRHSGHCRMAPRSSSAAAASTTGRCGCGGWSTAARPGSRCVPRPRSVCGHPKRWMEARVASGTPAAVSLMHCSPGRAVPCGRPRHLAVSPWTACPSTAGRLRGSSAGQAERRSQGFSRRSSPTCSRRVSCSFERTACTWFFTVARLR